MLIKNAHRHRGRKKAQSVVEYAIFIAAISAALIGLQIYFQRGVKGNYKQRADSVGGQFTTAQNYSIETQSQTLRSADGGYIDEDPSDDDNPIYWSKSTILDGTGSSDFLEKVKGKAKLLKALEEEGASEGYAGHEFSKTDYVKQVDVKGSGLIGSYDHHGTFGSATDNALTDFSPWEDAGYTGP